MLKMLNIMFRNFHAVIKERMRIFVKRKLVKKAFCDINKYLPSPVMSLVNG